MQFIQVTDFKEMADEFKQRVEEMVWCSAATVDTIGRPRTRVLHPIWDGHDGWIITYRDSAKVKHLAKKPNLSLAYIKNPMKPVYVDCTVEWLADMTEKQHVWDYFKNTPEPYGYNPELIFGAIGGERVGILKLIPWRIEVYTIGVESKTWKP